MEDSLETTESVEESRGTRKAEVAPGPGDNGEVGSAAYAKAVATRWSRPARVVRSFWQSPVVMGEINRRVTGDPEMTPAEYFAQRYCERPYTEALSLGCAGGELERELMTLGAARHMLGIDISPRRIAGAKAVTPAELQGRLEFACEDLEVWRPQGKLDLVIAKGVLHHIGRLEEWLQSIDSLLSDDGLIYFDDFVGPTRFQWTDAQLEMVNRLLERLSPELRRDVVLDDGTPRATVSRPSVEEFVREDPSEAIRSGEVLRLLESRFEKVEERPQGGALYHLFFNRIMANFAGQDDLVRIVMEIDAILTQNAVVQNDYLWAVYRKRRPT